MCIKAFRPVHYSPIRYFTSSSSRFTSYGFIGLGEMGQHMARHIYGKLDKTDKLYVYDINPNTCEKFMHFNKQEKPENSELLKQLSSVKSFVNEVDEQLDFIVTMVPEGNHVKEVTQELISEHLKSKRQANKGTVLVDSSTIDIPTSREIHEYVKSNIGHFDFIDAPVSGGVAGARKGTLSFMLSRADHKAIPSSLLVLLEKMGKNIFPCGSQHGSGLAAKLSNNYLLAITNLAVADSFQLAKSFGLNLQNYAKLVAKSTGKSWASVDNCPIPGTYPKEDKLPADSHYEGGFITKLTRKDLVLAVQSARANNRFLLMGDLGHYWYDKACKEENIANRDLGVLYEWSENIEGDDFLNKGDKHGH